VHPDYRDIVVQRLDKLMLNGEPNPVTEEKFIRLDGSNVPVDVSSLVFNYQGNEAVLVVAHDISVRKKMQDELFKAQKLESLGVLAGGIAHDFNNILTGILGNLSLARVRLDPSNNIAKQIDDCEKAAIRASDLAQQLLTFSRGGVPVKRLIDPASLIRETTSFVLRGSNVRSIIEMADDYWCVEADEGQLSQVMHNLLINALHAMPLGGEVTVRATNEQIGPVNTYQLQPGDYLKIVIEDNGCGIPPKNLARIFDPYFTTKPEGSGLGLASVYSIVKRHGGAVEVSSNVGVGSSFTIYLPASSCMRPEGEVKRKDAEMVGSGMILIMDDEEIVRDIATEILEFMGYGVEACSDGRQAIDRFRSARELHVPFDAVILDLTVPGGMGGRETAEHILKIDPAAILIVSSGYSNDPVVANYRRYGFSGVVSKPFTASSLARELERVIRKKSLTSD
jgi:signal transduction histidine kinase/CheY-like chemotaxis protein